MSPDIKVTDKRLFQQDGELREEYRYLEEEKEGGGQTGDEGSPPPSRADEARGRESPRESTTPHPPPAGGPEPSSLPAPQFLDLVSLLAEPAALYLGDAPGPDGESLENLPVARFHIDLLDVLQKKTEGNLAEAERAVLEDVIYRLRLRYVEKKR